MEKGKNRRRELEESIQDSEYILVGLGEEWESEAMDGRLARAYERLSGLISEKDYFIVTTAKDGLVYEAGLEKNLIVAPCGNRNFLQCSKPCCEEIWKKEEYPEGICPRCGAPLVINTVESKPYVEAGYLDQWQAYMSWLQRSLNRKLLLLELGVGFQTPTVIRWPFERTAYLNRKSRLYRVHGKFFQLPENLEGRGISEAENSVDWILENTELRH